jgi:hypothetical protein
MLDFCEAVGKMISDRSFRAAVFVPDLAVIDSETASSIVFPASSYVKIRGILNTNLSQHSFSLATDGEVIRVIARPKLAAHIETLAMLAEKLRGTGASVATTAGNTSPAFATALGALTLDPELRKRFLAAPGPIPEIPGLTSADITELNRMTGDTSYARTSDALCEDGWAAGCFARVAYYSGYQHPELKPSNSKLGNELPGYADGAWTASQA